MTDRTLSTPTNDSDEEDLVGAYALDALSAHDDKRFIDFLTRSERARIEAEELTHTAATLGFATAPVQPSAGLKTSIMSHLAATPQLSQLAAPLFIANEPVEKTAPPSAGRPADAPSGFRGGGRSAAERAETRWFQRPVRLLVASAAAVALFVGGTVIGQSFNDASQFTFDQAAGLAQINSAADSDRASTTTNDGHAATLVWSNSLGLSAVFLEDLPALASDLDYQLWYINASGPLPAGTFDSTGVGTVWRVLDGTMHAGDAVGVTVEPTGGSEQPTSDPIVAFQS